ncbi:nucleotidyltransferase domain-containing protein [Paenibacillus herberti]|uniref:nucleotidyltransferase domain-containing protein n=1 Tax=Paenibacillus herberti TaxID=1619309 RepID=UPI001FEADABD|nr:nucleotidyltransferase domain-containing protein [Paenibacillus herberti]
METQYYLDRAVNLFKEEMGRNLVGVHLHGSLAMGCFNPNKSDIDLLVVAQEKLSAETTKRIIKKLLKFHESMPNERGIELSIILECYLKNFVYPTPFEFHYSDYHRNVQFCLNEYIGIANNTELKIEKLTDFANYMMGEIKNSIEIDDDFKSKAEPVTTPNPK